MILVVDIGNTNINFGIFREKTLKKNWNIPTERIFSKTALNLKGQFEKIIICSVYPKATRVLQSKLKKNFKIKPLIVGKHIKVPIKNLYKKPKQVGQDRLVNAYAGLKIYGVPLIIVDFGTAITFDVVSEKGAYLGGVIAPGIKISLEALFEKCALLPQIKPSKLKSLIGKDTKGSILSGILYGFASLSDGIIIRLRKKFRRKPLVIATGGNVQLMKRFCKQIYRVDKNLTLKGLNLLTIEKF